MPRGRKRGHHRGGFKNFTNMEELAAEEDRRKREQQWRKLRGLPSESEEESGEEGEKGAKDSSDGAANRDMPPSDDSETESSEEEGAEAKPKGVSHLIEIENPNYVKPTAKKVSNLTLEDEGDSSKPQLTRKEREEIEKQKAKERYMKAHLAGKTEEAQADMARLALIRKQREDAARRREEEKNARDAEQLAAENRLLEKKKEQKK